MPPQRHPEAHVAKEPEAEETGRKPALKKPGKKSPSRSRSPIERRVRFAEDEKPTAPIADGTQSGLMRMKEAREAVPRLEGESRAQWKNRVFNHKRKHEEASGKK